MVEPAEGMSSLRYKLQSHGGTQHAAKTMLLWCAETEVRLSSNQELALYFVFAVALFSIFESDLRIIPLNRELLLISVGLCGNILKNGCHPWNHDEALFFFHGV